MTDSYMEHMGVWMGTEEAGVGVGRKGKKGKVRILYVTNASVVRQVGTIDEESVEVFVNTLTELIHADESEPDTRSFGQ